MRIKSEVTGPESCINVSHVISSDEYSDYKV
jgi:hypothetical protein